MLQGANDVLNAIFLETASKTYLVCNTHKATAKATNLEK